MKRKIDGGLPRAAKWVQLLGCVFGLVLMLTEPLSAQNRPKTKDLLGDWYLDFKFAETTKRGTTEYTVFSLEKSTYIDDEDLKVYTQTHPIILTLKEDGKAEIIHKEVQEIKVIKSRRITDHFITIDRTIIPLKWWFDGKRFTFNLISKKKKRGEYDYGKYELDGSYDVETLKGSSDVFLGDRVYEGQVSRFHDEMLKHLVDNLSQMTLEHFTPTSFVLNGRSTYKPLKAVYQEPLGDVSSFGWNANMVYATREKPQEIDGENYASGQEQKALSTAAEMLVYTYMKKLSPQSGQKPRSQVLSTKAEGRDAGRCVSSNVILQWEARDFLSGVPYGTCEVTGGLKVYPPLRSVDKWKAVFEMHSKNDHAARVTSASHWKGLESITFDLNSPTNDR